MARGRGARRADIADALDTVSIAAATPDELADAVTSDHDTTTESWSLEGPAQGRRG